MSYLYFGQWLLGKNLISPETLDAATRLQERTNHPLGAIAVELGLLTPAQVDQINRQQQRSDRHFGEIAQQHYWLTASQLAGLLAEQQRRHLLLGQALVTLGYLSEQVMLRESLAHRHYQQAHLFALNNAINGFSNPPIVKAFFDYTIKLLSRIVHEHFMIDSIGIGRLQGNDSLHRIQQQVNGDNNMSLVMALPQSFILKIETKLQQQASNCFGEQSLASAREVVKIISSHVRSKAMETRQHLNMGTPQVLGAQEHHDEGRENILARFVSPQEHFSLQLGFH